MRESIKPHELVWLFGYLYFPLIEHKQDFLLAIFHEEALRCNIVKKFSPTKNV